MNWGTERTEYYASNVFEGMELAYPELLQKHYGDKRTAVLIKRTPTPDRVAVIISGGAAGGPLFAGYVAEGLADACVAGGPYAAPNAYTLYEVGKHLGSKKGVLFLYNNFAGDFLNNDMAEELLSMDGIPVANIPVYDDIATAIGEPRENRGGRCGAPLLIKIAGAMSKAGKTVGEIASVLQEANRRVGTISMMVDFDKKEIHYGGGFSGEPGIRTETHMDMEQSVRDAVDMLLQDLKPQPEEKLVMLINRQRYTSYNDGFLMCRAAQAYLEGKHNILHLRVANYSNIIDAYGCDFTMLCVNDVLQPYLGELASTDSFLI